MRRPRKRWFNINTPTISGGRELLWAHNDAIKVMKKEGWSRSKFQPVYRPMSGDPNIVLMERPIKKPKRATRADILALRDLINDWLSKHA